MLFTKSLVDSLKHSHHKLSIIGSLLLLKILMFNGERSGNNDRRIIQRTLHQSE